MGGRHADGVRERSRELVGRRGDEARRAGARRRKGQRSDSSYVCPDSCLHLEVLCHLNLNPD